MAELPLQGYYDFLLQTFRELGLIHGYAQDEIHIEIVAEFFQFVHSGHDVLTLKARYLKKCRIHLLQA